MNSDIAELQRTDRKHETHDKTVSGHVSQVGNLYRQTFISDIEQWLEKPEQNKSSFKQMSCDAVIMVSFVWHVL